MNLKDMDFESQLIFSMAKTEVLDENENLNKRNNFLINANIYLKKQLISAFNEIPNMPTPLPEKIEIIKYAEFIDEENTNKENPHILPFEEVLDIFENAKNIKNTDAQEMINKIHTQLLHEGGVVKMQKILWALWVDSVLEIYEKALNIYSKEKEKKIVQHLNFWLSHLVYLTTSIDYPLDNREVRNTVAKIKYCIAWNFFKTQYYAPENIKKLFEKNPLKYMNYYLDKIEIEYPVYYQKLDKIYGSYYKSLVNNSLENYKKIYTREKYDELLIETAKNITYLYDYILIWLEENIDYTIKTLDKIIHGEWKSKY